MFDLIFGDRYIEFPLQRVCENLYLPIVQECISYGGIALWTLYEQCEDLCEVNDGVAACVPSENIYYNDVPPLDENCPPGDAGCACTVDGVCVGTRLKCSASTNSCVYVDGELST